MAEKLFSLFPAVDPARWLEKLRADLKGKAPESLNGLAFDCIPLKPFYTDEDRPAKAEPLDIQPGWFIHQDFKLSHLELARTLLAYRPSGIGSARFIVDVPDEESLASLLKLAAAQCDTLSIVPAELNGKEVLSALKAIRLSQVDPAAVSISIEADVCALTVRGMEPEMDLLSEMLLKSPPHSRDLVIDATHAGALGELQAIAWALVQLVQVTDKLIERGAKPEQVFSKMLFRTDTGIEFFPAIAKLRAIRKILDSISAKYGASQQIVLHTAASTQGWTKEDAHSNLLRSTTQAMAAVIGGAQRISLPPFDLFGEPGEFSHRLSRNIHLLLREESFLNKVTDPGAGSWYLDSLTDAVATNIWDLFLAWQNMETAALHQLLKAEKGAVK